MLPVLYNSAEFNDMPKKDRRQAAWLARQRSFRHWQMWASVVATIALMVIFSNIFEAFGDHPHASGAGALCGMLMGGSIYKRCLYRFGLPYYKEILAAEAGRKDSAKG